MYAVPHDRKCAFQLDVYFVSGLLKHNRKAPASDYKQHKGSEACVGALLWQPHLLTSRRKAPSRAMLRWQRKSRLRLSRAKPCWHCHCRLVRRCLRRLLLAWFRIRIMRQLQRGSIVAPAASPSMQIMPLWWTWKRSMRRSPPSWPVSCRTPTSISMLSARFGSMKIQSTRGLQRTKLRSL